MFFHYFLMALYFCIFSVNFLKEGTGAYGFNASTEEYVDLYQAGVIEYKSNQDGVHLRRAFANPSEGF